MCIALTGFPTTAAAATSALAPAPEQQAQERYQEGLEAFEAGRHIEAAGLFEEAFELAGDPTLLYNVSIAYEKAGKLEQALEVLDQYAELAPASELEDIDRQRKALRLRIEKAQEQDEEQTDVAKESTDDSEPPRSDSDRSTRRDKPVPEKVFTPVAGVLMGISGVALGVGVGLAIPAARADAQVEEECLQGGGSLLCPNTSMDLVKRRRGLAIGADVSFAVGIVAGIATIAILAGNASKIRRAKRDTAVLLVPSVGRSAAGLSLSKRF